MSKTADQQIRRHLRELVEPSGVPDEVLAAVEARRDRLRRRRSTSRAVAAAAVVVLAVGIGRVLTPGGQAVDVVTRPEPDVTTSVVGAEEELWPEVDVVGVDLGTLVVTTSGLRPAAHADVEHDLTFTNTGPEPVYLNDTKASQFVGDRELLVADEHCGYGPIEGEVVGPACLLPYLPRAVLAGESLTVTLSLWWDLAGMAPLRSPELVLHKPIVHGPEPFTRFSQDGSQGEVVITYRHLDRVRGG